MGYVHVSFTESVSMTPKPKTTTESSSSTSKSGNPKLKNTTFAVSTSGNNGTQQPINTTPGSSISGDKETPRSSKTTSAFSVSGNNGINTTITESYTFQAEITSISTSPTKTTDHKVNNSTSTMAVVIGLCFGLSFLICMFLILRRRHQQKKFSRKYVILILNILCISKCPCGIIVYFYF